MGVADVLFDKIESWVKLQKRSAEKLNSLAAELEKHKKNVNISRVVGSSVSVGGAVALTAAGIISVFTGGLAIPVLAIGGAVASGLGLANNVGSEVVNAVISNQTMKEAEEIAEEIKKVENRIEELMKVLKEEGQRREQQARSCADVSEDDYVMERILRAMAKREGLHLHDSISLCNMTPGLSKKRISGIDSSFSLLLRSTVGLSRFAVKMVTSVGPKAAAKAAGRIAGGAVGLVISVPELIIDSIKLAKSETESSKCLRENARTIQTASEEMDRGLKEIRKVFRVFAKVEDCIKKSQRSRADRKTLIDFVIKRCEDEAVLQWLRENSESEAFFKLLDMFYFLKEKIWEEEKKNHCNTVDITFVAHGAIDGSTIPASCLLPLPTLSDVLLYSPWNCYLSADAAYGIATGCMETQHRAFYCRKEKGCKIPDAKHRPTKLPNEWNSMKKAGQRKIPSIMLSPLQPPKDGAWKRIEVLENEHGKPGRNHIVIPFILPGKSKDRVPFFVVTLALSVVLFFSRFEATLHLTACLGKYNEKMKLDEDALKKQYACTIDNTSMTSSRDMLKPKNQRVHSSFKTVFD